MLWRFKYYIAGKREKLTVGRYLEIGLAKARELRNQAASLVALGDPAPVSRTSGI
jgi:hypothetical protein